MLKNRGQASIEYVIIVAFVIFIVIGILGIALVYSSSIKDRIKILQLNECANKIVSSAESVFYNGKPSKATISCYLPENIKQIEIKENNLIFSIQTSSGLTKLAFSSKVPIQGDIDVFSGMRKISVSSEENYTSINLI